MRTYRRYALGATFVVLALVAGACGKSGGSAGGGTNSGHMLALISSNQNAYLLPTLPRQQNRPDANTFEWTNDSGSTSSVRLLLGLKARN